MSRRSRIRHRREGPRPTSPGESETVLRSRRRAGVLVQGLTILSKGPPGSRPYHWREMSEPAIERLAGSRLLSRLPALLRTPFALNNFLYFGGNFFAGMTGCGFQGVLATGP